jgi:hypothetical protein
MFDKPFECGHFAARSQIAFCSQIVAGLFDGRDGIGPKLEELIYSVAISFWHGASG